MHEELDELAVKIERAIEDNNQTLSEYEFNKSPQQMIESGEVTVEELFSGEADTEELFG